MRTFVNIALGAIVGIAVGSAACCLFIHRRAVGALLTGKPLPEPPEWHKTFHPMLAKK